MAQYDDSEFLTDSPEEIRRREERDEIRRIARTEFRRMQSGEADEEVADDIRREEEQRAATEPKPLPRWVKTFQMFATGEILVGKGATRIYDYVIYIALLFFLSIVVIFSSLRYEVRGTSKEIVVDKADLYENELLNPLKGLSKLSADYEIEERIVNGSITISLVPKQSGEVMSIEVAADGESISKVRYGGGDSAVEMNIKSTRKIAQSLPRFSKERYEGYEIIDFR